MAQSGVLAVMNSIPFDWLARRYVENHLSFFILEMLTFPDLDRKRLYQIGELAAELSCEDEAFADFAAEAEIDRRELSPAERRDKRAQIDALVAYAYGLTYDELEFIFTDFTENAVKDKHRNLTLDKFEEISATA